MKQSSKPGRALVLTLTLCVVLASRCAGVVYVKWDSPGPILDGASWATAFHCIQDGVNAAGSIDEVWVARGTYTGNVILRPGVSIYGGFAGTETSRLQRNWQLNPTVVDGGGAGAVITGEDSCTIDGFIIRNGDFGVLCSERSPTVTNNRIIGNIQGIYAWCASPVIANNIVAGNDYGINCDYQSGAIITNNTVVGNGIALECAYSSPTVTNNILAFSDVGIRAISALPMLSHNDVHGNGSGYEGVAAGDGDISADPLFASRDLGNLHIQPNSPCRNAGVNGAPSMPETDMDGQPRIMGDTVDIGADESDGQYAALPLHVVYVNASAPPGGDGGSWSRAYKTIQAAVDDAAYWGGAEIRVAQGVYYECVKLMPFAHLYGGFVGTETLRSQRNWRQNVIVVDAGTNGHTVWARGICTVDGFTLRNGLDGVHCTSGAPMIANNTISGNATGVYCGSGHPDIRCNTFSGNECAIYSDYGAPTICNNIISSGTSDGIYCWTGSPRIANNIVSGAMNCGLYFAGGSPSLANTIIAFNGIGVRSIESAASLSHNDVYANTIGYDGIGAGPGDISADPQLVNPGGGDYHLGPDSPCINAGDNLAAGIPSCDMDGETRIANGTVDIGPDERWYARLSSSADGTFVQIRGSAVTAAFDGHFYIESDDRSWGIRVNKASHGLSAGMRADIRGMVRTNSDGARYVDATSVVPAGAGCVAPVFLANKAVGGADWNYNPTTGSGQRGVYGGTGLNNIGLLVSIAGRVTHSAADFFYMDDGSGMMDASGHLGIRIRSSGLNPPQTGAFARVVGISSGFISGGRLYRLITPRSQDDIMLR